MTPKTLTWTGGEHAFRLGIEHLRALEQRCNAGPEEILGRLMTRTWRVADVTDTIRLGLEGGGLAKDEARRLVAAHVEDGPLALSVELAQTLIMLALWGDAEAPPAGGDADAVVSV
ncbi:gene transfer agent family protein [Zavarzinia aquatilis]|uniref:Gene transfer agent family protein n=1 Tax=Zavarzinia aquatilis TaxID=2211142 RepID=A0A317ECX1_9PROT|nr:gene transfer agent family protein [Zavarzinia aquatilis]PWR24571.1 gene transfer agent family protein [Zavarzinia aquatilis]